MITNFLIYRVDGDPLVRDSSKPGKPERSMGQLELESIRLAEESIKSSLDPEETSLKKPIGSWYKPPPDNSNMDLKDLAFIDEMLSKKPRQSAASFDSKNSDFTPPVENSGHQITLPYRLLYFLITHYIIFYFILFYF